jgi:8-oxo-dGTP diphosphatase
VSAEARRQVETAIDVAVGVLMREDDRFLLARRPEGKPMPGYWEFPGGKLENGESVFDALVREFEEELGMRITAAHPWAQRVVAYPHATVRLHFWRSFGAANEWSGVPISREGQAFRWEAIDHLTTDPWLPGAMPVKRWMQLPSAYAISHAAAMGIDRFLARLDRGLVSGAIRLLQLREPDLDESTFAKLFDEVRARCWAHGARLLINSTHPPTLWSRADGVHMTARDLMRVTARPDVDWCIASCHDADELARAGALGFDAAVLGSVAPTASHPGGAVLGWERFAIIAQATAIPVYAIGGMTADDLVRAITAGAHGIAMIRAAWG